MSANPKISVVIPNYNRETYVRHAIDSILAQSFKDFELLVIDDGSTDESCAAVLSYDDPRIRLIRNSDNLGVAATRNTALAFVRGEYLAYLDSDDVARPERLAKQSAFLDSHPDHGAVGCWVAWMDSDGKPVGKIKRLATGAQTIAAEQLFRPGIVNSSAMIRSRLMADFPYREDMVLGEDFDMWVRFAARHKIANLPQALLCCRRHDGRITGLNADQVKAARYEIYKAQFDALGVAATADDLDRHFMLRRMQRAGFIPDDAYVDWARTWLVSLRNANHHAARYPEPAFSQVLGVFWAKTCDQAGWGGSWRRFLTSPLCFPAALGLIRLALREKRP